ncbi:MAG: TIGR03084 family protein [Rhodococcus sp.]|nr:TIGR03084 family protein [Rhodococcus sp. (in: high G+C Gram-positive bacteria)]
MTQTNPVLGDLQAEGEALDALVAELEPERWKQLTPAQGWTIAHQIGHLNWTDEVSLVAITDRDQFYARVQVAAQDPEKFVDHAAEEKASQAPDELLPKWRAGRQRLVAALDAVPAGDKIPWFGPPMSATSMATARLMETWAHGRDVADALGVVPPPTHRLKNVAHLGVCTRDFAYLLNEKQPPADQFRIELAGPSGERWTWGPDDAEQSVRGSAEHFCLLVTQRAHRDDLDLVATGADADEWLSIAQAFAGPRGEGRKAGAR